MFLVQLFGRETKIIQGRRSKRGMMKGERGERQAPMP